MISRGCQYIGTPFSNFRLTDMKFKSLLSLSLLVLLFLGCSDKKKAKEEVLRGNAMLTVQPSMEVNAVDTNMVLDLSKQFLEHVKNHDIDGAMAMLYYLDKDSIVALPQKLAKEQRAALQAFPVYGYAIENLIFYKETDSQVKYSLLIQDPKTVKNAGTIFGLIRPVRRMGKWYLTLADSKTDSAESEIGK